MTRILRIALLVLVPTFALGALASGCGDDTTTAPPDLSTTVKPDMAHPADMAHTD